MGMTEEERFRFDLSGFLVRPAILDAGQIAATRDQIHRIKHDPQSLPPEHRAVPSGPSSILIDHPKVIEVLHEIIGPDIRLEGSYCVWRKQGEAHGALHGGGPQQAGPIWKKTEPRVAVLNAYSHLATHWHRLTLPPEVLAGLPREKQAYFRAPWVADFRTSPATINTIERFVGNSEPTVDTAHQP